ncbi:helix-turn-helix domain-containing protein [Rossellomorea marisflavi]|uniref:helix-turn-helix domain-containing protein n=1 Tax=Rossellomorea marisflavi TaxID=189381 RepID=UPI003D2EA570
MDKNDYEGTVPMSIRKKQVVITLKDLFEELQLSPNHFATEYKIRPNTIYKMVHNQSPRPPLETLAEILNGLNDHADKNGLDRSFDISDILKYAEKK